MITTTPSSRRLDEIIFLTILTENKIKVTSSGTSPASIDKILKMALTPPGGRDEGV